MDVDKPLSGNTDCFSENPGVDDGFAEEDTEDARTGIELGGWTTDEGEWATDDEGEATMDELTTGGVLEEGCGLDDDGEGFTLEE